MDKTSTVTIGYWKIRGLISPCRYMLEYLGVDYNDVQYEQGDAPEFSRDCWLSVKPTLDLDFPNLPYLVHGDLRITESQAMMRYIANTFGPADFSGKDNAEKAKLDMLLGTIADIKSAATNHCYGSGDRSAVKQIGLERMEPISKYLGDKKFLAGDYITFVDFFLFEQIELFAFATEGEVLAKFPNLAAYHKTITSLPKFAEYYKSDKFMVRPFNNKIAKINN